MYEVVSEAIEPLWRMMPGGDGAPLLLDRRVKLVPGIDGYPMPDFYHWLLLPFSERKVGIWILPVLGCAQFATEAMK